MVIVGLALLGLCLGSFINALVWRIHEQSQAKSTDKDLSILHGRSMCPNCHHKLVTKDLIPVWSWLSLKGKCRYCSQPISAQYPLVELITAGLFIASYIWWPHDFDGSQIVIFSLWLVLLTGLLALLIYDLRWQLLPNRLIYPLSAIASLMAVVNVLIADDPVRALLNTVLAVLVGGGVFYLLFQVSQGKWIGGGDVKLGWLLGLVVGTPAEAILLIFLASAIGSAASLPLLMTHRLKRNSTVPFGPFLIVSAIVVQLFGDSIIRWYQTTFLGFTL